MIDVRISGPTTLIKRTVFRRKMKKGVKEATIYCHNRARFFAPFKTGRLRNSIQYKIKGLSGRVFTNIFYAWFIEFGTRFIDPRPFMRPARESAKRMFNRTISKKVKESL